jgi:hypothetical protein
MKGAGGFEEPGDANHQIARTVENPFQNWKKIVNSTVTPFGNIYLRFNA